MGNIEITSKAPLLDSAGSLSRRGWARHMLFDYDPRAVKASPFSLKEWDFYQISDGRRVLQMTVGHVSYMASVSANLFDLQTGERRSVGRMSPLPFKSLGMERDGERPHTLVHEKKGFEMRFEAREDARRLTLRADRADVDVTLRGGSPDKDKMVIATPFSKPRRFYLNYKENCFTAEGRAAVDGMDAVFGGGAFALLDWGRGVWPFRHEWIWGNGSTVVNGRPFGFNIGWGFGDTSAATENAFFYDGRLYKLGEVTAERAGEGYMAATRYRDGEGLFDMTAEPVFDNFTATRLLFVDNSCHQVFSRWRGRVVIDGKTLEIPEFIAFCEHARNRW